MDFSILSELVVAILTGIIQGATEFLPVSSTAHVRLVSSIIASGRDIGISSSNIIQLGTLVAVVQYFWQDLKQYASRLKKVALVGPIRQDFITNAATWLAGGNNYAGKEMDARTDITLTQLAVGTVPILIFGLLLTNFAGANRSLENIAWYLVAGSLLMAYGEFIHARIAKNYHQSKPPIMTVGEVVLVGLYQSLAIFPGISRSGATIAGALMLGRSRKESVRFSFLLSLPAVLLAGIAGVFSFITDLTNNYNFAPSSAQWTDMTINLSLISLAVAAGCAYYVGYKCLVWLIRYLSNHPTRNFIYYRLGLALLILVLSTTSIL